MKRDTRRSGASVNYTQRNYMQNAYHKDQSNNRQRHYQNLSSGYYMSTSNAVARDYWYEEEAKPAVKKVRKPKNHNKVVLLHHVTTLLIVFLLGMALVGEYAYIQNLGYQVSQSRNELKTLQEQNEKIKKQIAMMGDLQTVEAIAINNMGMHKPEDWEIIYLPAKSAASDQTETEAEAGQATVDEAVDRVKEVLGTIFH